MDASSGKTLVGWKAIAGYFSRDERTVMRWAASRGLPVRRAAGQLRSSVYAWPADLDAWLRQAEPAAVEEVAPAAPTQADLPQPATPAASPRRLHLALAVAAILIAALGAVTVLLHRAAQLPAAPAPAASAAASYRDPAARAAYLQASFDWNLRTRESLERAIGEYGAAVARDPGVAASYIGLANSYLLLREYGAMPEPEAYARAAAAASVAVGLDPRSMEAERALAFIAFWSRGDVAEARRRFTDAVALAPGNALTHHWYATALAANGERQAAFREISAARAIDPTSSATLVDYGYIAYLADHRPEARQVLRALIIADAQDSGLYRTLASIALSEGRYGDYLAAAARSAALRDNAADRAEIAREAADFAQGGAKLMFRGMIDAARAHARETRTGFYRLAQVAAIAGRAADATEALTRACTRPADPAAIGAPGDLWLASVVPAATVGQLCGRGALDGLEGR